MSTTLPRRSARLAQKYAKASISLVKDIPNTFIKNSPPLSEKPVINENDIRIRNNIYDYLEACNKAYGNYEKNKILINMFYYLWENECLNFLKKFQKLRNGIMDKIFSFLNGHQTNDIHHELKETTMYVLTGVLHEIMIMNAMEAGKLCDCCEK